MASSSGPSTTSMSGTMTRLPWRSSRVTLRPRCLMRKPSCRRCSTQSAPVSRERCIQSRAVREPYRSDCVGKSRCDACSRVRLRHSGEDLCARGAETVVMRGAFFTVRRERCIHARDAPRDARYRRGHCDLRRMRGRVSTIPERARRASTDPRWMAGSHDERSVANVVSGVPDGFLHSPTAHAGLNPARATDDNRPITTILVSGCRRA